MCQTNSVAAKGGADAVAGNSRPADSIAGSTGEPRFQNKPIRRHYCYCWNWDWRYGKRTANGFRRPRPDAYRDDEADTCPPIFNLFQKNFLPTL